MAYPSKHFLYLWAGYVIRITKIISPSQVHSKERERASQGPGSVCLLFKLAGSDSLPGGTLSPRDKNNGDPTGCKAVCPESSGSEPPRLWLLQDLTWVPHPSERLACPDIPEDPNHPKECVTHWTRESEDTGSGSALQPLAGTLGNSLTPSTPCEIRRNTICLSKLLWRWNECIDSLIQIQYGTTVSEDGLRTTSGLGTGKLLHSYLHRYLWPPSRLAS